jgi:CHASE2 domain-containing sensor protein
MPEAVDARPPPQPPPAARGRLRHVFSRRWAKVLLAAHVAAAAVLLCRELAWLQPLELAAYDRLVAAWAGREASGRVVLVTVREADVRRPEWPLPDEHLHRLLDRLVASGARAIGVDIYRDRPVGPGGQDLADFLARHPQIVWVFALPDEGSEGVPPPPVLAGTGRAALADVATDAGGVVRRGLLAATDPGTGRVARALGAALAELYAGERLGRAPAPSRSATSASRSSIAAPALTRAWTPRATRPCSTSAAAGTASRA